MSGSSGSADRRLSPLLTSELPALSVAFSKEGEGSMGTDDRILAEQKIDEDWLGVLQVKARLDGAVVTRTLIEHPSGSVVLPYNPSSRVAATIRQTRLPVLRSGSPPLREPVAGASEGETPAETARRECLEETGIRLRDLEFVGHVWMDPSSSTERAHIFLGAYSAADRVNEGGGVEGELENVEINEEPLVDLWRAVERGEPMYVNLLICLQALRLKRPELVS